MRIKATTQLEHRIVNRIIDDVSIRCIKDLSKAYGFKFERKGNSILIHGISKKKFEKLKRDYKKMTKYIYGIMYPNHLIHSSKPAYL